MNLSIRARLSILVCKLLRKLVRMLHRGGTAMPGRVAMKICPDLLSLLAKNVNTVAVTGTNGKTTCSRIIEEAFRESGLSCFSNKSGANLMSGIVTEFVMNCSLSGKMQKSSAVIECDEAAARAVFPQLQPKVIVVTNLFRDQLDRYGEITHTLSNIREGIRACPSSILCLNADCSLTASLSLDQLPNQTRWFGIDASAGVRGGETGLSDASYCIRCKAEYVYDYHTYAHLGGFRCPDCGYSRPYPEFGITRIVSMDQNQSTVIMRTPTGDKEITINLPAAYNLYNAVAAVCASESCGIEETNCLDALSRFSCGFGRMETFPLGGGTRMILIKNPAGCSQALEYLSHSAGNYLLVVCLNDRAADGTDISWIWDADFERLAAKTEHLQRVFISGDRACDMFLRLKYAGIPEKTMQIIPDYENLVRLLESEELPIVILPTYTAMLELRSVIVHHCGGTEFWE